MICPGCNQEKRHHSNGLCSVCNNRQVRERNAEAARIVGLNFGIQRGDIVEFNFCSQLSRMQVVGFVGRSAKVRGKSGAIFSEPIENLKVVQRAKEVDW